MNEARTVRTIPHCTELRINLAGLARAKHGGGHQSVRKSYVEPSKTFKREAVLKRIRELVRVEIW